MNPQNLIFFYNTENFFPPDPKPVHKLDPTKSGLRNWDERKYRNKLHKIANVFRLIDQQEGILPMLIGLAEISERSVLEDLLSIEPFAHQHNFGIVHYNSMDERGVDVALLYDKNKIEILHSEPISYTFEMHNSHETYIDTTRDVLYCKVRFQTEVFHLFVVHLPSKREHDINLSKREHILKDLNNRVSKILDEVHEPTVIMGDFNDNPDEKILQSFKLNERNEPILINPFEKIFSEKKYSVFHGKNGLVFDQVILSQHFFNQNSKLRCTKADIFNAKEISSWDKNYRERPFRTYVGTRYLGGYSDHFPVFVKLESNYPKVEHEKQRTNSLSS